MYMIDTQKSLDMWLDSILLWSETKPERFIDEIYFSSTSELTFKQMLFFRIQYLLKRFIDLEQYEKCEALNGIINKFYKNYDDKQINNCLVNHLDKPFGLGYLYNNSK